MNECRGIGCHDEIYKEELCYEHYKKYIHFQVNTRLDLLSAERDLNG